MNVGEEKRNYLRTGLGFHSILGGTLVHLYLNRRCQRGGIGSRGIPEAIPPTVHPEMLTHPTTGFLTSYKERSLTFNVLMRKVDK